MAKNWPVTFQVRLRQLSQKLDSNVEPENSGLLLSVNVFSVFCIFSYCVERCAAATFKGGMIYSSDSSISKEVYTGGVSYQLTAAFGISTSVDYGGSFTMSFVDSSDQVLAELAFTAADLAPKLLQRLRLDYTVGFENHEVGQPVRVAIGVLGQGPSPVFTRMK
jgi:hypothetical protein